MNAQAVPMFSAKLTKAQFRFVGFVALVMVFWNLGYYYLKQPGESEFYDYRGTEGPFAVSDNKLGEPISQVKRGAVFGWKTDICIKKDVPGLAITELVHTPSYHVVNRVEVIVRYDQQSRCGPRAVTRLVPIDAPEGYYELKRSLLLQPPGRAPINEILPSLHIQVVP